MRLWSLHPKYLDPKGLVALWREGLLAQAVIAGQTRGYKHHPQLKRFLETAAPCRYIAVYLRAVYNEAVRRGYQFDANKIGRGGAVEPLPVARGQIKYEWAHLMRKLDTRSPLLHRQFVVMKRSEPHPLFCVVAGGVADWESVADRKKI
ncbi:MAG TPA: pyrimidine dimer DNA glycosylase/endonuclease V [Burkholderiales bacterium]|nr:pyrimidine dimer DNA glycosylase/endonuclease V [Burkholderiales bacterium]